MDIVSQANSCWKYHPKNRNPGLLRSLLKHHYCMSPREAQLRKQKHWSSQKVNDLCGVTYLVNVWVWYGATFCDFLVARLFPSSHSENTSSAFTSLSATISAKQPIPIPLVGNLAVESKSSGKLFKKYRSWNSDSVHPGEGPGTHLCKMPPKKLWCEPESALSSPLCIWLCNQTPMMLG